MTTHTHLHDVLIAGAGPVGLFLACELRLAGCSVLVLERAPDPSSPLKRAPFGLRGLSVPTIESFDRRGLLDGIADHAAARITPRTAHWMNQQRRPGGHFAGIPFFHDRIDTARWRHRLPGRLGTVAADMASIEAVLTAHATASGVEIRRGRAVDGVEPSDEAVIVRAGGEAFRGRWLVGCDGARSTVRKAAGIGFTGTEPEFTGYSLEVVLDGPHALEPGRHATAHGMYTFTPPGTIGMADFDGGAFHRSASPRAPASTMGSTQAPMAEDTGQERDAPTGMGALTRDHVETVLRRISGTDVTVGRLVLATTWTDRAYQATAYRNGRVLLAGDAAHIHSPLGGQGLNLGLGDAMNLGWKLAARIGGTAPVGLLDSYESERHPVAARVLDWSRAQVALMRPGRGARALEAIVRDLVETPDGATYFAERAWGVSLRYDLGGDHPLVGCSVPDFVFGDGRRVGSLLRDGKGLLLDFDPRPSLQALAKGRSAWIDYAAGNVEDRLGLQAVLVRPDGIVAWAGDAAGDPAAIDQALGRWFGD